MITKSLKGVVIILLAADELFQLFAERVAANPQLYYNDYQLRKVMVRRSSAWYKGRPVDFLYQPMFFTSADLECFEHLTSSLTRILLQVIDRYRQDPVFRTYFAFPPLMEELIMAEPGYEAKFPIARFDLFYQGKDEFKFCELNADGTSSMNEVRVLHDVFKGSAIAKDLQKEGYSFFDYELFDTWAKTLISYYHEFKSKHHGEHTSYIPKIAIVDFEGEGITSEFFVFQECFRRQGYTTIICDPRELRYRSGSLYCGRQKIDLVYRRATTARLVAEASDIKDFLQAYLDQAVCVVGGFVSQIIHNKKIFAILHDQQKTSFLSKRDRKFIEKHIPYTFCLRGNTQEQLERILENKDKLVLKPFDLFAGRGVYLGCDYSFDEWEKLIYQVLGKDYLVQELCSLLQRKMLTIEDKKIYFENYKYMLGLFMYNQKFSGIYTRVGRKNMIAAVQESFTLPNFIVR
ncbi:MAG: glutathionylspermidine synthase family protein [Dethiobacteria bacterium]|jgi:glutathionylspermidine synthase|nr:glutathionylspermidine synthase family protein [Bacillota bacterium]